MGRRRERASGFGLLPRMEARPRKDGKVTYRYHPIGGKPINLGTDRDEAIRQVLGKPIIKGLCASFGSCTKRHPSGRI